MAFFGLFSKEKKETLDKGLEKTKQSFFSKIARTIIGKSKVDSEVLDDLEEILISSDVGVETTLKIKPDKSNKMMSWQRNKAIEILIVSYFAGICLMPGIHW
jgi:signal recognition particle GTPase